MAVLSVTQRIDLPRVDSDAYSPVVALDKYVRGGTLGDALIDLVKIRASQINGCAFCLAEHHAEARKVGIPQRKIDTLSAWREAPGQYTAREQAAIAFTEEVTEISRAGVSDATWASVHIEFNDKEIVHLLMAICAINIWNRIAISVHMNLPPERH